MTYNINVATRAQPKTVNKYGVYYFRIVGIETRDRADRIYADLLRIYPSTTHHLRMTEQKPESGTLILES